MFRRQREQYVDYHLHGYELSTADERKQLFLRLLITDSLSVKESAAWSGVIIAFVTGCIIGASAMSP